MPRESTRNHQLRQRVAQLAAKLMAEHGIRDHVLAKRKAARQLGIATASALPGNEEIDEALKAYLDLFEPESHESHLDAVFRQAVEIMDRLAQFQPIMVGGLATGAQSRHMDIELEVHVDSSKEFERFLLNHDIAFKSEERRSGSFFTLFDEPVDVVVRILPERARQYRPRAAADAPRRMTAAQLRRMLADDALTLEKD